MGATDPEEPRREPPEPSFGNVSDRHWSRARAGANEEAIAYYRERSRAPGVAEGGGARNHYCMACDGVIPFDHPGDDCPHCGASLAGAARRYFNWVEIDKPPRSDLRALLPFAIAGAVVLAVVLAIALAAFA